MSLLLKSASGFFLIALIFIQPSKAYTEEEGLKGIEENGSEESIFEDEDMYRMGWLTILTKLFTGVTVPSTKWCGLGNSSSNYDDLGEEHETDMCCRDHDHCDKILEAGTEKYGLRNNDSFPILQCSCEEKFRNCLEKVNSWFSEKIKKGYFLFQRKCFAEDYPITKCKEHQKGICIRYEVNKSESKKWQFFDTEGYFASIARR